MKPSHPRRILVIRTDKIGDMVLSTAALRAIHLAHPDARLVVLASPYNAPVIEGSPVVHAVEHLDHCWPVARRLAVARALRRENFDLCLVFNPNQEAYLLAWWTGAETRAGIVHERRLFDLAVARALLSHPVRSRVESAAERGLPVPHEVDLTRRVLESAGIRWAGNELDVPTTGDDRLQAGRLVRRTWPCSQPPIGFHLSMKWLGQGWTIEDVGRLLAGMVRDWPERPVLVTWGPCDGPIADALLALPCFGFQPSPGCKEGLKAALDQSGRVMVAQVDFRSLTALLSSCSLVVTRDTGSLHVASALRRPVVAVYEPGGAYPGIHGQFAPWLVPNRVLTGGPFEEVAPLVRGAVAELSAAAVEVEHAETS